jgi:hypothetical protein
MAFPRIRRSDFSHSLVHLTKNRKEYEYDQQTLERKLIREVSAFDVLKEILVSGTIRGSGNDGYVKGDRHAVCLSEIPLSNLREFADAPYVEPPKHKYRMYGITLSKDAVFKAGGRPVFYLPDTEGDWIPAEQKWRQVRFEHPQVDFTHEREWRVPVDVLDLTQFAGMYVVVWNTGEAKVITKLQTPVSDKILGVLPMEHISAMV